MSFGSLDGTAVQPAASVIDRTEEGASDAQRRELRDPAGVHMPLVTADAATGTSATTGRVAARWLRRRRVIDAAIVVVTAPVTIFLAGAAMAAVAIADRSVPLIRLTRVGRGGVPFDMVKIRSMRLTPPDSQGPAITASTDQRVTRVGAVLRATHLDELPQLFRVVTGRLALIGPRPETPVFVDLEDPLWRRALSVRPGIAGITQVIASPWESTQLDQDDSSEMYADVAVPAKVAIDAWYAEHASFRLDLAICVSLLSMMVAGRTWTAVHDIVDDAVPESKPLLDPFRPTSG